MRPFLVACVLLFTTACSATTPTVLPTLAPTSLPQVAVSQIVATQSALTGAAINPTTAIAPAQSAKQGVNELGDLIIVDGKVRQIGRGTIKHMAYAPNGKWVAVATSLGVQIFDSATLTQRQVFSASVSTLAVAFSPDSEMIAVNDSSDKVSVYNHNTLARMRSISIGADPAVSLQFIDAQSLGVLQAGGKFTIWDITKGVIKGKPFVVANSEELGLVLRGVLSRDGKTLYINSGDNTLQSWDVEKGSRVLSMKGHEAVVANLTLSADGNILASVSDDHTVRLWNAQTGASLKTLKGHATTLESVAFSSDGKWVASGDSDRILKMWDRESGNVVRTITDTRFIKGVLFSADNSQLIVATATSLVTYDTATGNQRMRSSGFLEVPSNVLIGKDSKLLAYSDDDVMLLWRNWNSTAPQKNALVGHNKPIISSALSPDGQWLAAIAADGETLVWNINNLSALPISIVGFANGVMSAIFTPESNQLLVATLEEVRFWDVKTQKISRTFKIPVPDSYSVAFSRSAGHMAIAAQNVAQDDTITVVDIATQKTLRVLRGIGEPMYSIAYSADGLRVAAGGEKGSVMIWNEGSGDVVAKVTGDGKTIVSLAFSGDGSMLVTGDTEGRLRLYQLPNAKLLREFTGHVNDIVETQFMPATNQIISAGADGTLRFWDVR